MDAAAYAASKAYENEFAKNRGLSAEIGKAILNTALQTFVESVAQANGSKDFDKEQAKEQAKKQAEDALENLGGIDPRKMVSRKKLEEFNKQNLSAKFSEGYVVFEAPDEDIKEMEKLLGIVPGTLGGGHFIKIPEGSEYCGDCGRHYSFLDIAGSGAAVHSGSFMKDVLTGNVAKWPPSKIQGIIALATGVLAAQVDA
ncbi:hypothetical protein DXG01_009467 [Tephrocybe rancida]|nr:hypothetical protein DXG01_009467 [Tephrocybe rancida]